jgi:hypothetical protein
MSKSRKETRPSRVGKDQEKVKRSNRRNKEQVMIVSPKCYEREDADTKKSAKILVCLLQV